MGKFQPSKYQQALFDWIVQGQGSAIVEAVAGSGKTTSMVQALNLIDPKKSILFLAFNKSIAEELKTRAPKHVACMTMNSLGHRAVMKQFGKVELDTKKTSQIIEGMIEDKLLTEGEANLNWSIIVKLVAVAKSTGLVPKSMPELTTLLADTPETWDQLIAYFDIEFPNQEVPDAGSSTRNRVIDLARIALERSIQVTDVIDFNDQLYFPVIYGLPLPQHDWVFVDEAQDISAIQRTLLGKALKKGGRLVAVGDPKQAIYAFRGADSNSLNSIAKTFNCISLPLSISYRCPKAVVRAAQAIVSYIEPADTAPEGLVADLGLVNTTMFKVKDMVVCRNTAPLVRLAYMLISAKVPAKVMGRDIGEGLASLVKKLKARSINELTQKLETWKNREIEKLLKKDPEASLDPIEDRFTCLSCFIECSGAVDVDGLLRAINSMFGESSGGVVTLSTIHKAKGLEAERVFILDVWRLPSFYAKLPHQLEQEYNLLYVAITRAQKELYYVAFPRKEK
jgi:superfamily I DNA/RNA helicase